MQDMPAQLTNRPRVVDGPITRLFRACGVHDFAGAAIHVLQLPYGRIKDRNKFWLVLEEGRGTCERFLHEEPITVDQIGAYKNDLHKAILREWIARMDTEPGRTLEDGWRIREERIAALGSGAYATPAR